MIRMTLLAVTTLLTTLVTLQPTTAVVFTPASLTPPPTNATLHFAFLYTPDCPASAATFPAFLSAALTLASSLPPPLSSPDNVSFAAIDASSRADLIPSLTIRALAVPSFATLIAPPSGGPHKHALSNPTARVMNASTILRWMVRVTNAVSFPDHPPLDLDPIALSSPHNLVPPPHNYPSLLPSPFVSLSRPTLFEYLALAYLLLFSSSLLLCRSSILSAFSYSPPPPT